MALINLEAVYKSFSVIRRGRGLRWLRPERMLVEAVDDVSFSVEAGEAIGYIGPNGAGKSTTIKLLTGILVPSSGRVTVADMDPSRDRVRLAARIGVVFGQRTQLWWDLPLADSFELLRYVYRIPIDRFRSNLETFVDILDLQPLLETPVRQLSLGQRMRGDLAAAMLHDPEIVFLDEPTIGLDVVAKERIRRFLAELNTERGVTVILTTHDLSDVERLCRRILIIDRGRLIYDGDLGGVAESFEAESTLVVDLYEPRPPIEVPGATVARVDGPRQWLKFRRGETSAAELIATVAASVPLADLSLEEPAIEEIVREIYERGLRRGETSVGRRPTTWPRR
jgi:ABC-2 type transport system ATP-binding protein